MYYLNDPPDPVANVVRVKSRRSETPSTIRVRERGRPSHPRAPRPCGETQLRPAGPRVRRGSLLVEAMAALAVLAMALAVAATSVSGVYRSRQQMLQHALAQQVLANAVVNIEQTSASLSPGSRQIPLDAWATARLRQGSVNYDIGRSQLDELWRVTVTVHWLGPGEEERREQVVYWVDDLSITPGSE